MNQIPDHYEIYYADKLWNLFPAVYRSLDTDNFNSNGPLREMVNRIGVQAAILRRSIDRMWEDQSIETCDDWIIPYIGDLVATNLVANLNARSQRLDVANTIDYRRRKGTLGLLEELSFNITGWNAKVIEFFRRLGRTRHGLDPQIGQSLTAGDDIAVLQVAEGLVGSLTQTPIGGTANLRNVYGSSKSARHSTNFSILPISVSDREWWAGTIFRGLACSLATEKLRRSANNASRGGRLRELVHIRPDRPGLPSCSPRRARATSTGIIGSPLPKSSFPARSTKRSITPTPTAAPTDVAVELYPNSLAVWSSPVPSVRRRLRARHRTDRSA